MKVATIKSTVLASALLLFCGHVWLSSRGAAQARSQARGASRPKASQVRALFDERCARCHGRDGRGRTTMGAMLEAPDFTDARWQKDVGDERMRNSIRNGRGEMPAFDGKLSRRDIAALLAYVRGFTGPGR